MDKRWWNFLILFLLCATVYVYLYVYNLSSPFQPCKTEIDVQENDLHRSLSAPTTLNFFNCNGMRNMKKILLAINYNFPHYSSAPILREFYGPIFGKVIFCGENEDKHLGVIKINENKGYQGYECVATAIRMFPHFSGYIHTNDDLILNWWNILGLDVTKIWAGNHIGFNYGYIFGGEVPEWHWWTTEDAAHRCEVAFKKVEDFAKTSAGVALNIPLYLAQYFRNTGNIRRCINDYADFFYIPAHLSKAYAKLSQIYSNENVFLEVGAPTILVHFVNETNYHDLRGSYFDLAYLHNATYMSGEAFYETFSLNLNFSHPFKLNGNMKKANNNFFRNVYMPYGELVKKLCSYRNNMGRNIE